MGEVRFCFHRCRYLKPTEDEQTKAKEPHMCKYFNKQVKHYGHHPNLVRLPECKFNFCEVINELGK
jgi:hypothetical protein